LQGAYGNGDSFVLGGERAKMKPVNGFMNPGYPETLETHDGTTLSSNRRVIQLAIKFHIPSTNLKKNLSVLLINFIKI
jgi:hypothetical protein